MLSHTTDTVCALTGASLPNLRRWQRHGLVRKNPVAANWTGEQLSEIYSVIQSSASGATAQEISDSRCGIQAVPDYGWSARLGEMILQLDTGSDRQLTRLMRSLSRDFCGDDFINRLMKPLGQWLRRDIRTGSAARLVRFQDLVELHSIFVGRASVRAGSTPLLLELTEEADDTDVLLEVIRLTGQGFCVDVFDPSSGPLSVSVRRCYDHHLQWCDDDTICFKADSALQWLPATS